MGILENIKKAAAETGGNKGKFIYWKSGDKKRIRFLTDMEEAVEVTFHDSYSEGINIPCQKIYGKKCPCCDREGIRTRQQYIWSIYDYEAEDVKLMMFPVNSFTPVPALVGMYEAYGSMTDRDYLIARTGKQKETSYSVVPMDKVKFRNDKAKPYTGNSVLKMLNAAYPANNLEIDNGNDNDEEEGFDDDNLPFKDSTPETAVKNTDEKLDYSEMSAKQLYKLCEERGIIAEIKKPAKYYIEMLEHWDKAEEDWG